MVFRELMTGEAFTVSGGIPAPWRIVLRKASKDRAQDDHGVSVEVDAEVEVDPIATSTISHALWFEHEGTWKLILRWTNPREERARWASVDPEMPAVAERQPGPSDDRRARALLASALQARGDSNQAIALYDDLLSERPEAALLNNRGAARAAQGDYEGAIADYTLAVSLDDGLAQAFSNRGNAMTKLGRHKDAIGDYDRAIARAPGVAAIHCNRGLARKVVGQLQGSLDDFDRAVSLDAQFAPALLARGSVRALMGDFQGAVDDLQRFLEVSPTAPQVEHVRSALERLTRSLGAA
jgi:tetratricopeptide (TPR) repeat protein